MFYVLKLDLPNRKIKEIMDIEESFMESMDYLLTGKLDGTYNYGVFEDGDIYCHVFTADGHCEKGKKGTIILANMADNCEEMIGNQPVREELEDDACLE